MKARLGLLLVWAGAAAAGCQSIRVRTQYDHQFAFRDLHTFSWAPPPAWLYNDPRLRLNVLEPLVKQAVESQLTAKGFQSVTPVTADFHVTFRPALQDRFVKTRGLDSEDQGGVAVYEYSPDTGGHLWTSSSDTMLAEEREGSLVIEIIQANSGHILWKGTASANVNNPGNAAAREQRVKTAVRLLMEQFPPSAH